MKFIIDMDGVIYRGNKKIEYAGEFIEFLKEKKINFLLATNNSTKTAEMYVEKLRKMGIYVEKEKILTSGSATARYLKIEKNFARVLIVGEEGLFREFENIGWEILDYEEWEKADYVVVGMDRRVTYEKLKSACLAIYNGAKFIGTNGDRNFPSEEGLIPGAGSFLSFLESATQKKPVVIGKPNEPYIEVIKEILGFGEYWVVGDREDTDMLMGKKMNAKRVLILTGVTKEPKGDEELIFKNLGEFIDYLRDIL